MQQNSKNSINRSVSFRKEELEKLESWSNFLKEKGVRPYTISFLIGSLICEYLPKDPARSIHEFKDVLKRYYDTKKPSPFDDI